MISPTTELKQRLAEESGWIPDLFSTFLSRKSYRHKWIGKKFYFRYDDKKEKKDKKDEPK